MNPKLIWASKTFWFNAVTFLVAVLGLLQGQEWIADYPQVIAGIGMAVGVLNIVLRWLTDRPVIIVDGRRRGRS